jgi:HlyD family secretion protein
VKKLLLFLVLIFIGLGIAAYSMSPGSRASGDEGWIFTPVEFGNLTETVSATGGLQPRDIVAVGSQISGEVVKIYPQAELGKMVSAGQPLLELDSRLAKLRLNEAKTAVKLAKANVEQAEENRKAAEVALNYQRELKSKDVGVRGEEDKAKHLLDTADAALHVARVNVERAEDALKTAQLNLDLHTVRAAGSGVIIEKKVVLGQMIAPPDSAKLFVIAGDMARIEVNAQVPESDIGKVRVGENATFTVYAYSDDNIKFSAKVDRIYPVPTNVAGAVYYNTILSVDNRRDPHSRDVAAWMLRPGMTATVDIVAREHQNVWKLPVAAVNLPIDEHFITDAARNKLEHFGDNRKDLEDWKYVWVMKPDKKPWPIFVRLGGTNAAGESLMKDSQFYEVQEWDPELTPKPDPKNSSSFPRVITEAPAYQKPGLLDKQLFKVS